MLCEELPLITTQPDKHSQFLTAIIVSEMYFAKYLGMKYKSRICCGSTVRLEVMMTLHMITQSF